MENPNSRLALELADQIDNLKIGGLISHPLSNPEKGMHGFVQEHLDRIALLQARGDTAPERPMYLWHPEAGFLISYSSRRESTAQHPERSGLFASIVELDSEGKPRHGVSRISPFYTTTGFVKMAIGDNPYGFAPSFIDIQMDSDDPFKIVPPNIPIAKLFALLSTEPIPSNQTLQGFLKETHKEREALRGKVAQRQTSHYIGSRQGLTDSTNPEVHLIISDRDISSLAAASREVGLYPIHVTTDHLIQAYRTRYSLLREAPGLNLFSFISGIWTNVRLNEDNGRVDYTPGYITVDDYQSNTTSRLIEAVGHSGKVNRSTLVDRIVNGLIDNNPVFACLINESLAPDYNEGRVRRVMHGHYEQAIDPADSDKMKEYTDWLRKVRLDMALTLYLRGLSEIG